MSSERVKSSVLEHALRPSSDIDRRLAELEEERDLEGSLEMIAAAVGMAGLFLGIFGRRRYLLLPALVLPYLYREAIGRQTPASQALRRLGLRSRHEIAEEYYALKALRGDFAIDGNADAAARADRVLKAIDGD
jgi:hypothetical protein